ncbi:hypothetical protein ACI797_08440 [Geodermatophilus sp. SYSU D00691]
MSFWSHIIPLGCGVALLVGIAVVLMLWGPGSLSDEAIATLIAGAIGVLGTHVGHVSGHVMAERAAADRSSRHRPRSGNTSGDGETTNQARP